MDSEFMPRKRRPKKQLRRGNSKKRRAARSAPRTKSGKFKKRRGGSSISIWKRFPLPGSKPRKRRAGTKKYRTVRSGALKGKRVLTKAARRRIGKRAARNIGHFEISFKEANRVRRMKGRKLLTRGQYKYRVARNLPVTI